MTPHRRPSRGTAAALPVGWGRCALASVCLGLCACAPAKLPADRLTRVRSTIAAARADGAYRCAPRELAMAQAHLDFAIAETVQGDLERAEAHLGESELNARAARGLSPSGRCGDKGRAPVLASTSRRGEDRDRDGVPDRADLCPDVPEDLDAYLDRDGCPDPDNDDDGVPDAIDRCRDEAEDLDGFQDGDGCPERDNDGDGFEDPADDCPQTAGVAAHQGCPAREYDGVKVTVRGLVLERQVAFQGAKSAIKPSSAGLLDTLAQVLRDHPAIVLEVGGHTDSRGDDDANLALSQARAEAVRDALLQRGIPASRLTARGYGETRPIESNRTSQGRAINRRIEFLRSDRVAAPPGENRVGGSDGSR